MTPPPTTAMTHDPAALLRFLDASPTPFHAVANVAARLREAGYTPLDEAGEWPAPLPQRAFFTRNDSSLIAVNLNADPATHGFRMVGAHTDSPCLKLKPHAITHNHGYAKLAVEVYGGALLAPWFDRGLGLAGRVAFTSGGGGSGRLETRLINIDRPIAIVPSLAIHLDRDANDNRSINKQTDMPALLCRVNGAPPDWDALLAAELRRCHPALAEADADGGGDGGGGVGAIHAFELCLYDCQPAEIIGLENEFIAGARLDNLLSCHAGTEALLAAADATTAANQVLVMNDHEEVGSTSAAGADGSFLHDILQRICGDTATLLRAVSRSMLVSADNAHGVHPNFPDRHDPAHQPLLGGGVVLKFNSNQRYATNAETAALFRQICARHGLPHQAIAVRADMSCGSTIGPITAAKLGVRTLDIGVPQLAMHSIRELAAAADQHTLQTALARFYDTPDWPF